MTWVIQLIPGECEDDADSWGVATLEDGKVQIIYWCDKEEHAEECRMAMASYDAMNAGAIPEMPTQLVIFTPSRPKPKPRVRRATR